MTGRGAVLAVASLACLGASWALGYPEFAVLGSGGLLALALGGLMVCRRPALRVRRQIAPLRVARGGPALGMLTVSAAGRWASRPLLALDTCGDGGIAVPVPRLSRGGTHTMSYFLPTRRRGEIAVGPLRLADSDAFGLWRRVRAYGDVASLLVHPRTVELPAPPSGRMTQVDGPVSRLARAGTVTFQALRPYVLGDDLRHIHWRTSARTGTLMVRQLVDSSLPHTTVVLDNRASAYPDESALELAVDVAASIAVSAVRAGYPVSVHGAGGPCVRAGGGRAHVDELLRALALLPAAGPADLAGLVAALRPGPAGGSLAVVTGVAAAGGDDRAGIAAARDRFDSTVLVRVGADPPPLPVGTATAVVDVPVTGARHAGSDASTVDDELLGFAAAWRRAVRP